LKKFLIFAGIITLIAIVLTTAFLAGFFTKPQTTITLENPLKNIVLANMNAQGQVNQEAVIEQGIQEFNQDYINYLLVALGVNNLHSMMGYGNPIVEFQLEEETWSSEIDNGILKTQQAPATDPDLKITISKQESIKALLSPDIKQFMKDSVTSGNTQIKMITGKTELAAKGYLGMYNELIG